MWLEKNLDGVSLWGLSRIVLILLCLIAGLSLTGCKPSPTSVEGRKDQLEAALQTEAINSVEDVLAEIPPDQLEAVLNALSFISLQKHSVLLSQVLEGIDPRWRFDMKGFSIDYLKQVVALNGLEEANTEEAEAPMTIIEPCKTFKEVLALYLGQLKIDGMNPPEDMFVKQSSISVTWQYQAGVAQIKGLELEAYNIVNKRFYQVTYQGNSLTVKPMAPGAFDYKDLMLTELMHQDYLARLLPLVPKDVTAPIKMIYVSYRTEEDNLYSNLPVALLGETGFVYKEAATVQETLGRVEIAWNPALAVPPQAGGIITKKYLLGMPQQEQSEE